VFSGQFFNIALQVVRSWQVIVAAVVIVIYMFLVSYVAKMYNNRGSRFSGSRREKASAPPEAVGAEDVSDTDDSELGLEE
jgi:hypothetical protein